MAPGAVIIAPGAMPASAIANFTAGDTILVPFPGITDVEYAATGAGIGTLSLLDGNVTIGTLTLLGVGAGQGFTASPYGGETQITTQPDTSEGGEGMGQGQGGNQDGSGYGQVEDSTQFLESQPLYIQSWLAVAIDGLTSYVWTSPDGSYWGPWQPGYANIGIISDPVANTQVGLPSGYVAILAEGGAPFTLTDAALGNALLVGNAGRDTIVGLGANDTLIGGQGPGSLFWTNQDATIVGTGNDTIVTGAGDSDIIGSTDRNLIFLGAADDMLTSNGTDTIIGSPGTIANDTVHTTGRALIFAPPLGQMTLYADAGADTVVCSPVGGTIRMYGGPENGGNLWGGGPGSFTEYFGGQGTAVIIGDSGAMYVQGGAGAMTVYGGTGQAEIYGTPGPSAFVLGNGDSTVTAASGNGVWLAGAGNESLVASGGDVLFDGAGSWGSNVFQAASGPVTMIGGSGADLMVAGSGNATMEGGAGAETFSFIDGRTGGANTTETISDFHVGTDLIELQGYAGGIQAVLNTQTLSDGNTAYTLPDGTHLVLLGISGLTQASFTGS
jgi:Ca2+-binding RTX toxin-like protein